MITNSLKAGTAFGYSRCSWAALGVVATVTGACVGALPPPQQPSIVPAAEQPPTASIPIGGARRTAATGVLAPPATFHDEARIAKIRAEAERQVPTLEKALSQLESPAFAWGLVVDDQLLLSGAGGSTKLVGGSPATVDTVFRIGSITKVFTSLAALQLRDAGRLSLGDSAEKWVPEMSELIYPTTDSPAISLRQLMTHSSGLPRQGHYDYATEGSKPEETQVRASLKNIQLQYVPGTDLLYSNLGAALLGLAVGKVAEQPYREVVTQRIFQPLGMVNSQWSAADVPEAQLARPHASRGGSSLRQVPEWDFGAVEAMGGIYSSVRDLSRFAVLQLGAWPASNEPESSVLRRSSLRQSQAFQVTRRLTTRPSKNAKTAHLVEASVRGKGLGWSLSQNCRFSQIVWHNGGTEGHSSVIALLPDRGIGLIALANRNGLAIEAPVFQLLGALDEAGVLPKREKPLALDSAWLTSVKSALSLMGDFQEKPYRSLFSGSFQEVVPVESMRAGLQEYSRQFGRCTVLRAWRTYHPIWKGAELSCTGGANAVVEAAVRNGKLTGFRVLSQARAQERATEHRNRYNPQACATEKQSN